MGRMLAAVVATLLLGTPAFAESPDPSASPTPRGRLKLDPWVDPYGKTSLPDIPRYRESVDVPGKAMDSASLTARMAWFMGKEWEPMRGAVPRGGSAPTLEETYPFRPRPAPAADVSAFVKWLADELAKR